MTLLDLEQLMAETYGEEWGGRVYDAQGRLVAETGFDFGIEPTDCSIDMEALDASELARYEINDSEYNEFVAWLK